MKLSVSAYRAQASAHKKILCNYQHQLSYGATSQVTGGHRTPSDPAAGLPQFKVRFWWIVFLCYELYTAILVDLVFREAQQAPHNFRHFIRRPSGLSHCAVHTRK